MLICNIDFALSKGPRAWLCKTVYICKCSKQGNEAKFLQFRVFFSHVDRTGRSRNKTEAFCQKVEWEMKCSQNIFFCLFEWHRGTIHSMSFFVCSCSYTLKCFIVYTDALYWTLFILYVFVKRS